MAQREAPPLRIKYLPTQDLIPYERNPRKNDHAVKAIANSIKEYGWTQPIVCDPDGTVIAGHTRLKAAKSLGLKTVPVFTPEKWTPEQAKAYRIADNKLAEQAEWDIDLLRLEMGELADLGVDALAVGFSEDELARVLAAPNAGQTDPDDIPEPPVNPVTRPGDVWLLGKHRLVCGDSTNPDDVAKCLNGVTPHLMVTDPPYGVEYDADWRNRVDRANGKPDGARAIGRVTNDDRSDWREAYVLFPGDVAYVWHPPGATQLIFGRTLQEAGFDIRMVVIWAKQQFPIGRGHYHVQHEPCYYAVRKKTGSTGHWQGSRKESTLWQIDKPQKSETGHSTQKPIECMARPIRNNSSPGQAVYEPFAGSGTTLIAAEMEGRICHAIEIEPKYCDVIVKRWQNFTGKTALNETNHASTI